MKIQLTQIPHRAIDRREAITTYRETLKFPKKLQTPQEINELKQNGFVAVISSWVSAVGVEGNDLFIRFHDNTVFKYNNMANQADDLLASASKGRWVHINIINRNVKGLNVGSLPLKAKEGQFVDFTEQPTGIDDLFNEQNDLRFETSQVLIHTPRPTSIAIKAIRVQDKLDDLIATILPNAIANLIFNI